MFTTLKDAEAKLLETVSSIEEESSHWKAIHFHFSELLEHYRSDYQIKIAVNLVSDLLKSNQGGIFILNNADMFLVCRGASKNLFEKVIFQLRYLFMDDPLAYTPEGAESEDFCTVYDLATDWKELFDLSKRYLTMSRKRADAPAGATIPKVASSRPRKEATEESAPALVLGDNAGASKKFFNPSKLANVERDLTNADLSMVIRRQPVCAAVPSMMIRRVFDELYINIAHLRQLLKVDADLLSNRWLFKYLTQLLDDRMIDMLRRNPTRYFDLPVSLNLNIETLLSNKFAEFDAAIKPSTKVSIVIEIQVADVFADMNAFLLAKEYVQKLGYRVCLDGLTNLSFTQVDRERLGFDLAKLQWNADIESDLKSKENKKVADAIKACGPNRIILCRCDSRQAIDYGQAMGISLFQGRYLDSVMNPTSKIEN